MALKRGKCKIHRLYHGTNRNFNCNDIEPADPRYEGSLGYGMYLAQKRETAEFYGGGKGTAKVCRYDVRICKPFNLTPDSDNFRFGYDDDGGPPPDSILSGESIQPFDVKISGEWEPIRDGGDMSNIGYWVREAGYDALVVEGLRGRLPDEEVLVFDRKSIVKTLQDE